MTGSSTVRRLGGSLAGLVALTALVAVPAASAAAPSADTALALAHQPAEYDTVTASSSSNRSLDVEEDCFDDATDDVVVSSEGDDNGEPIDTPKADIVRHCVDNGPSLALTVELAAFSDPFEDEAWQGATFVGWFVDTDNDDEGDYLVEASLTREGDEFVGTITDVSDQDQPVVVCTNIPATATEFGVSVSGIDTEDCLDDPDELAVGMAVFYDHGDVNDGVVSMDAQPDVAPEQNFDDPVDVDTVTRNTDRYAGPDRIATSIAIAQAEFPEGADVVYLARDGAGDNVFADAVAGGVLTQGPIILVPTCGGVPDIVVAEVDRQDPDGVVALGGPVAICDDNLAAAANGLPTSRLAGGTRFETAVEIAEEVFPDGSDTVYLARSDIFADAAVGGVVTDGPILLVPQCGDIPDAVTNEIRDQNPSRLVAFGGTDAICDATVAEADEAAVSTDAERLQGPTRIETSIAISQDVFPRPSGIERELDLHLARADVLADALVGGILTSGPIVLVPSCGDLPERVGGEISRLSPETVIALGGPIAVCDDILDQASRR